MSSQQRFGLIALAAAVAVAAFLIARPSDDEDAPATSAATTPAQTETAAPGESAPAPEATEEEPPAPESVRIRVRGGEPEGGLEEITVAKGATVRLVISADSPYQVHVHGYDLFEDAAPDAPARFTFDADLEGVFEVELEGSHVQVAELRVEP